MVSYESVKCFDAEEYEFNRYRSAVDEYLGAEYHVLSSLRLLNICRNIAFITGLLATCFLCVYQMCVGQRDVSRFVSLLTYVAQLQGPLAFFRTVYSSIQSTLTYAERMAELFRVRPTVVDSSRAKPLATCRGDVMFRQANAKWIYLPPHTGHDTLLSRVSPAQASLPSSDYCTVSTTSRKVSCSLTGMMCRTLQQILCELLCSSARH